MTHTSLLNKNEHPAAGEVPATPEKTNKFAQLLRLMPLLLGGALLVFSVLFIYSLLATVTFADINNSFWSEPLRSLVVSAVLTTGSYVLLTSYDALALRSIELNLPLSTAAFAGFTASAFSQTLGFSAFTGSAVRFRIYGVLGLPAAEISRIVVVTGLAFWLGLAAVAAVSLLTEPNLLAQMSLVPPLVIQAIGVAIAALLGLYLFYRWSRPQAVEVLGWLLPLPGATASGLQILLGAADMLLSATALWVLLPAEAQVSFLAFTGLYTIVIIAGYLSHVPGGLGILEVGMLLALPQVPPHSLLAALLLYRCIYYIFPFAIAAALLAAREAKPHFARIGTATQVARPYFQAFTPPAIATAVFVGGMVLLFSGSTPTLESRMEILRDVVPLPFVELSHLIGSIAGFFLVFLASGLYRRLDAAWTLTVAVLLCGIAVSILKGLDWEEASVLTVVLALTVMSRSAFYRRSSLLNEQPSPLALLAGGLACAGSIWIGFLAYKQVDYSNELWWQVAYAGDASRFLRASLLVALMAGAVGLYFLLRPARGRTSNCYDIPPDAVRIANMADSAEANLALTGDKRFLMADERDAFLMYDVQGASWIAMGDPIGNAQRFDDLLWRFHELADRNGGKTVFYEIGAEHLPHYLDLGLSLLKLGEEAWIDLQGFSLEGGARANLRQSSRKAEKQGLSFTIVPAAEVRALLPELKEVSSDWLAAKKAEEKGFSVGQFDPTYLAHFDHALVRHGERIVAFANLWQTAGKPELSVDLMRHRSDAPRGHMDYLFVQLMLWAKAQGYQWFNLGMAPLSGLEKHPLAPTWHKAGNIIFQHGEQLYGFEGLRAFKEKFRPEWRPRYLACAGGLSLPLILLDVTLLISRRRKTGLKSLQLHTFIEGD